MLNFNLTSDTAEEEEEEAEEEASEELLAAAKKPKVPKVLKQLTVAEEPAEPRASKEREEPNELTERKISNQSQLQNEFQLKRVTVVGDWFDVHDDDNIDEEPEYNKFLDLQSKRRAARKARNEAMQSLRDLYDEQLAEHNERKVQRDLLRWRPVTKPQNKSNKKPAIKGFYDIAVPPEPVDYKDYIVDNSKKVERFKRYKYPARHCHHIDLSFVRYFDLLTSLTFEFLGPRHNRQYHQRHLNFSYEDMSRLAKGLRTLNHLEIFRLRNSRMDAIKLIILSRVLKQLDSLQTVDFGGDELGDDCNIGLGILLDRRVMLKSLELEHNQLGRLALESVGNALRQQAALDDGDDGETLRYLGLSHNPVGETGFQGLISDIIGTQHVQELNIIGLEQISPSVLVQQVCNLLRQHAPIRSIQMMGNGLNNIVGLNLLRALEQNHKIRQFDCRDCDLSFEQEFEIDVIMRRNEYEARNTFLGDTSHTEETLLALILGRSHPIMTRVREERAALDECRLNRPAFKVTSEEEVVQEEQPEEQPEVEFDIWKAFGIGSKKSLEVAVETYSSSSKSEFVYNSNAFTLDETREHMYTFGPSDRYYYFQRTRGDNS